MTRTTLWTMALISLFAIATPARAEDPKPADSKLTRQLMMAACYVKEDVDRAWQFKLVGRLPRGPGIYIIIYNEAGEVFFRAAVPWGDHTEEKPYIVDVPADGKAQQYVIKFVAQQDNLTGIVLPFTDLPYEVYGDGGFAFGHGATNGLRRIVSFQAPSTGDLIWFNGWSGNYRILDEDGNVVADSKDKALPEGDKNKKGDKRQIEMPITLPPGKTFWIDPYGVMYLHTSDTKVYVNFEPKRWFEPNLTWSLKDRPWWKGMP